MQINKDRYLKKEKDTKACASFWQEFAKQVCEDFNIKGRWKVMIFKKAKTDMINLKSKVDYCKERGITNGRYLIAMYRSNKKA